VPETTSIYEPRDPAHGILYHLVQDHFGTFRAQAASLRDGEGLAQSVEREFREFLTCGCLAAGFARFHCDACGHDRLMSFSCKGRGFLSQLRRSPHGRTRGAPR
jgi:Transposase zinc-binding domain